MTSRNLLHTFIWILMLPVVRIATADCFNLDAAISCGLTAESRFKLVAYCERLTQVVQPSDN